ncbi:META domain-containing protein [Enterovirga sp.]|jgi:heat shock protein HslJ|uniref:META domain-containing protein n=1 Tax=Enterovirga sp. TaxID=2026350 RepID=UPI00261BE8CA|nr:META domain-containing protein [Enterovirga sp.]MDB5590886.1 heat-shock protein [Enterovirga sp.]
MRQLGTFSLVGLLCLAGAASAQTGKSTRGNQDQQAPGYEAVRKKEEKRFPLGTSWIAVSMNGKTFTGTERPAFSVDEHFRVRGFGGCNSFSATAFPMREQGIAVGPLALTKKSCDKQVMAAEMSFLTALRTSAKWDTQIGSLVIRGPNGELKFERSL